MIAFEYLPLFIATLVGLSVAGAAIAAFYPCLTGASAATRRFKAISSPGKPAEPESAALETRRKRSIEAILLDLDEAQKSKRRAKPTLVGRMRQAGLDWTRQRYLLTCVAAGLAVFVFAFLALRLGLAAGIAFGITGGLLLPHLYVGSLRKGRMKRFALEFPNAVDVVVRGVKSGLPLADCLKVIAADAQEPVRSEFRTIISDQTLGVPIDEAVGRLPARVPLTEANFFAIVIAIQSRTGGSLAEALSNLSRVLRERKKMNGKIRAMSAEAKASAGIIGSLPVVVAVLVYLTSPDYIMLLFETFAGKLVLAGSLIWMLIGVLVMRKIINFDF